ncbi:hypothetical protein QH73_0006060 [Scytonema millei VB511283]|uniref:Uncharacterized protein n=1 Tax=Scytonema millei VB511283 TaxID=1245923 RepID=A0A9X5I455_9CYAN|nr:hypothetical protein [Scytonema millei VB511283]
MAWRSTQFSGFVFNRPYQSQNSKLLALMALALCWAIAHWRMVIFSSSSQAEEIWTTASEYFSLWLRSSSFHFY